MLLYTDACFAGGESGLGACLVDPASDARLYASKTFPPAGPQKGKHKMAYGECCGAPFGLRRFREYLSGHKVIIFEDNNSSLPAFCKGFSFNEQVNACSSIIWRFAFRERITLWGERDASKDNISDGPSRGEFDACLQLGFSKAP